MKALVNACIFDGERFHEGAAVVIDDARIHRLLPAGEPLPPGLACQDLGGRLLAPGFIDLQVNGGGGVLFNDQPTLAGVRAIAASHRCHGTTGLLVTLISDHRHVMEAALAAVHEARCREVPGVLGIHLEGPYINPDRRGIHPLAPLRTPETDAVELLTSLGDLGATLITLAPEQVPAGFIAALVRGGVRVAAGHTAADYATVERAIAEGLGGFTHLFNAMTPLGSREPGAVGAALASPDTWCGLIVDGHHVHPASLRVALAAKPRGRMVLVTDAMPSVGSDAPHFTLFGERIERRGGRLVNADGTLAGADLTMEQAVRNARELLRLPLTEALRMASLYPATWLGLNQALGRIRPGYRADLVLLDDDLRVLETWIGGEASNDG